MTGKNIIVIRNTAAVLTAALLTCGCAVQAGPKETAGPAGTQEETERQTETGAEEVLQETQSEAAAVPETEAETEEPEPVVQTVTITAVGDCTLGATQTHGYAGSFHEYYDSNGEDYFFEGVRDLFEDDDFTLINLECVLSESEERVDKTWNLKGKPEYVGIMSGSSVEACSLGNNHNMDYGEVSLEDTKNALDHAGILYGLNEHVATYETESGIVVGIVSSNLLWQDEAHRNYIRDGIAALREQGADLVIACCHWGIEGDHYANDYQRDMAHQIIDWGADLLIGTHPHVLQGVELYNGKVICYSLGNFCFGGNRNPADKDTAVFRQTFTFVDHALQQDLDAVMVPYRISSVSARNDFHPTRAADDKKQQIISDLNDYSAPYSEMRLDEDGALVCAAEEE